MRIRWEVKRRLLAAALAAGTLWTVGVTAGSDTAASALDALGEALPGGILRWELGELWTRDRLSPAAAAAVGESPLLLCARPAVAALWEETETPEEPQEHGPSPVEETPLEAPSEEDNGVPARTLVPRGTEGYLLCGRTYISNSSPHTPAPEEIRKPFAARLSGGEGPELLILHTHGSEAYTPPPGTKVLWSGNHRSTDQRFNVVRVGDAMAEVLGEAGISVLHDRTLYDYPSYGESYDRALEAIEAHLADYPSIRFILDIHRDAIEDREGNQYKVVSSVEGLGTAAQVTLVVGSDGSGLPHPGWLENLRLGAALQERVLEKYPTLMRPLLLRSSRYNQHTAPGALLVEVGAAGNSPGEALLAGRLLAGELAGLLKEASADPAEGK